MSHVTIVCSNRVVMKRFLQRAPLHNLIYVYQNKCRDQITLAADNVTLIESRSQGVSKAKNIAIRYALAHGATSISFLDDDCVPDPDWQRNAQTYMQNHSYDMVFGKTLPYLPTQVDDAICPCTFEKKPNTLPSIASGHVATVGFGNNCIVRADMFRQLGCFKEWLGPGSALQGGEDAEFILRSLIAKAKIGYSPQMLVYHDKWLKGKAYRTQMRMYYLGGTAAYAYHLTAGNPECFTPIADTWRYILDVNKTTSSDLSLRERLRRCWMICLDLLSVLLGFVSGCWYRFVDSSRKLLFKQ